jgi:23S rRNA pseudouridine1911/1915/1917 synthase
MKKIVVPGHEAGERLDAWLAQQSPEKSRNAFQKLIRDGGVLVNGKIAKAHYTLKSGDSVEVRKASEIAGADFRQGEKKRLEPKIIDETDDFLVLEKPSGLLVHPAPSQKTATLIDFLLKHAPSIANVGDAAERPGIVHRLDREASGLMVVAKNKQAFEHLKKQFQEHLIKKEYLALVYGKPSQDFDTISTPIGRKKGKGRMSARARGQAGDKEAVTHYDILERFPQAALVKVRTETGRMHQVRVHMKSIGHPLVGDTLYATTKHQTSSLRGLRLFLHAATLGFKDRSGAWHEYHSELPPELAKVIETLKAKHAKK